MDRHIQGVFPGGPRRDAGAGGRAGPVRRMEDLAAGAVALHRRRGAARRRRRWTVGSLVAVSVAGIAGYVLGRESRATAEQLTRQGETQATLDRFISREVNRTLLELWRMEDVERIRAPGAIR